MMKSWLKSAVFSLAFVLPLGAAPQARAEENPKGEDRRSAMLAERLKLTDAQRKTVDAALQEKLESLKALRDEQRVQRKKIEDKADEKIMATLDEAQKKSYQEMRARQQDRREEMLERRGNPDGRRLRDKPEGQ